MIVVMHVVKAVTVKPAVAKQLFPDEEVSEPLPTLSRTAEEDARQLLRELLKEIQTKTGHASSVFGYAELSTELYQELIDSISSNCQYITTIDYIMDNFPIFNRLVAKEILTIIDEIFNDIDEGEFLIGMDESFINDMLFLDVEEQAHHSDSEELDSDYYVILLLANNVTCISSLTMISLF